MPVRWKWFHNKCATEFVVFPGYFDDMAFASRKMMHQNKLG